MQPQLTTSRLRLRPAVSADEALLQALWDHPDVRRYLFDDQPVTAERAAETLAACLAVASDGLGLWMVQRRQDAPSESAGAELIGCAGLMPAGVVAEYEPRLAGLVEVLVALHPSAWGAGYAVEVVRALVAHAFGTLDLKRLAGVSDVPNVASARMLERAGFGVLSETAGPRHRLRHYLLRRGEGSSVR